VIVMVCWNVDSPLEQAEAGTPSHVILATLKAVCFYLLHNVSTLNQCRKFSCVTVVCKHFASYQCYPDYKWDLRVNNRPIRNDVNDDCN
jgi:hypothetical protein